MKIWGVSLFCDKEGNQIPPVDLTTLRCPCSGKYNATDGIRVEPGNPVYVGIIPLECGSCGKKTDLVVSAIMVKDEE